MERAVNAPLAVAVSLLAALSACSAQVGATAAEAASQTVAVAVDPSTADLAPNQAIQFAAAVTGTADVGVTWQVDEAGGGTIDQNGLYTAPGAAGSFHVRAVSRARPEVSGVGVITVSVPPAGVVSISPKAISLTTGGTVTFTATVSNLPSGTVTWALQESGCGTISAGVYTAPTTARTCHVVATSVSDASKSDTATVTVTGPPALTLTPATATVDACKTFTFTATVSGGSDPTVNWSVAEGATGGSVTSAGVYTAPASAGTYHVVATARASAAATKQATVTVQDHILSVAVNPPAPTLVPGATQQFTATVTTTCGAFLAQGP